MTLRSPFGPNTGNSRAIPGSRFLLAVCALALSACQTAAPEATAQRGDIAAPMPGQTEVAADICLASAMVPAVAPGSIGESLDEVPLEEHRFAVPCPDQMDTDFLASLQRALIVRGYHEGTVSGEMDSATTEAIRRYQRPRGLDSEILSLDAARALGLVAVSRASL